jgi:hypothetical protein
MPSRKKNEPPPVEPLWRIRHLAAYLGCSRRWVRNHLHFPPDEEGSIPHLHLPGGSPRFDPDVIRRWLEMGCPPARVMTSSESTAYRQPRKKSWSSGG